jgi:hypothetical protein
MLKDQKAALRRSLAGKRVINDVLSVLNLRRIIVEVIQCIEIRVDGVVAEDIKPG